MRRSALGFTLVELLIVVTIIALLSTYALSKYSSFGEDQKLKNASLDIQSLLRQAQANSTSNLKCQNAANLSWLVEYTNSTIETRFDLKCEYSSGTSNSLKAVILPSSGSISVASFTSGISSCPSGTKVTFTPLYGTMTSNCNSKALEVTLTNSKTDGTKQIKVEPGGRIYEPQDL
ncbi:prepilin-type N-terminal cleavage/methylation domain-containing protein [Candidatus Daviesbacteria bacterium]|nr:prepilin-type N-terminal cleavage/methylation domain-containing protein [Candidatus Daviesbacteria bacterium]